MIKRVAAILVLALLAIGCATELGEPVQLLPGYPKPSIMGCYTLNMSGPLVVDPEYGTALMIEDLGDTPSRTLVRWPEGYTARRAGSEVAVLDENGNAVAVTGKRYRFEPVDLPGAEHDLVGLSACVPPVQLP